MDESTLFHELIRLKEIEKEYKNLHGRSSKGETVNGQRQQTLEQDVFKGKEHECQTDSLNNQGVIFVNPTKINSLKQIDRWKNTHLLNQYNSPISKSNQSVGNTKIYVNPNFKSSVSPSSQNDVNKRGDSPNHVSCKSSILNSGTSNIDKQNIEVQKCQKNLQSNCRKSNETDNSYCVKKMQKIYINQRFANPDREGSNTSKVVPQKLSDDSAGLGNSCKNLSSKPLLSRNCTKTVGVSFEIKSSNKELSSDFVQKPVLHVQENCITKEPLSSESTKQYQTSNTMIDNKIFLNPKFRRRLPGSKAVYGSSLRNDLNENHTLLDKDLKSSSLNTCSRGGISEGKQESVASIATTNQSLPGYGKHMTVKNTKTVCQRARTVSTCLVSVSATKIVRRRKSNQKFEPNVESISNSNKLLFLSKTKLVRNALLKNGPNNRNFATTKLLKTDLNLKNKLKSILNKNLQRLTPDKFDKLSKQSLVRGGLKVVDILPKVRSGTNIKSNNGESLNIITSHKGSNESIIPAHVKSPLKQPLFISKTKLVRKSTLRKDLNNDAATMENVVAAGSTELKSRKNLNLPKRHLQYLTLHKINNQNKPNASSSKNFSNDVPKLTYLTKKRFNNGKSLKLVQHNEVPHRNLQTTRPTNEKYSMSLKHKKLLQQQMNKNTTMCMPRNKGRKTQFSKINVPVKRNSSQPSCHNKFVYKSTEIIQRRHLTKATVLKRRGSFVKVQASLSTDKTKYIKSKYNLVKKYSYRPNKSVVKGNKDKPRTKLESTLQMKWRIQDGSCKKNFKRKERTIVNIGGVFYQCSRTSLTRNKPKLKPVLQKNNDGTILHIHGQKFKLERNGLTLTCLDKNPRRKRVDLGGVTFISSSSGTSLTRTNYHTTRSILVHAKQKSIFMLTRKLKKNNEPCLFFHRFGKCSGKERGTCVRQHDPKNVAVCKKFVQGSCSDDQCLLSHTISCHNMPTCQHFLAGHCSRDHCLYPHIKVNDSAPICLDFLKGYCQLGDQCTKRHRDICPTFEKGVCPRGKYCPYPHPNSKSGKSLNRLTILRKENPLRNAELVSSSNIRYFDDVHLQKENKLQTEEDYKQSEGECMVEEEEDKRLLRNRPKLGRLPSFIPLMDDDFSGRN